MPNLYAVFRRGTQKGGGSFYAGDKQYPIFSDGQTDGFGYANSD